MKIFARIPGGIWLFGIAFFIGLSELYIIRKANLALRRDPVGEFIVPVYINGKGPIYPELDTGAHTTKISVENGRKVGLSRGLKDVQMSIAGQSFRTKVDVGGTTSGSGGTDVLPMSDVHKAGLMAVLKPTGAELVPRGSNVIPGTQPSDIRIEYEELGEDASGYSHIGYINVKISGKWSAARIDTGAPLSDMTEEMAEDLGLEDEIVRGTPPWSRVVGHLNNVSVQLGNRTIKTHFTVYEESDDFIKYTIGRQDLERLGMTQVYGGNQPSRLVFPVARATPRPRTPKKAALARAVLARSYGIR